MSFATDFNETVMTPTGVRVSRMRARPVLPVTPDLPEDTPLRTADGEPLIVPSTGAQVHYGDLPIERRWAVDPSGKILDQRSFEDRHLEWYIAHFKIKDKPPDDPTSRPIPKVEEFCSQGLAPDGTHYQTVGFDPHKPPTVSETVRPENLVVVDPKTLDGRWQARPQELDDAGDRRLAAMEAKLEALVNENRELREKAEAAVVAPPPNRKPRKRRPMTEEEKDRARANLAKARAARAAKKAGKS